jgi:hypothetical protein
LSNFCFQDGTISPITCRRRWARGVALHYQQAGQQDAEDGAHLVPLHRPRIRCRWVYLSVVWLPEDVYLLLPCCRQPNCLPSCLNVCLLSVCYSSYCFMLAFLPVDLNVCLPTACLPTNCSLSSCRLSSCSLSSCCLSSWCFAAASTPNCLPSCLNVCVFCLSATVLTASCWPFCLST